MAVAKLHAAAIREGRVYAQFHIRGCAFVFTFETYEGPGNVRWWSVGVERGERGWSQLDEHLQPGQLDNLEDCLDLVAAWLRDSHRLAYVTGTDVAAASLTLVGACVYALNGDAEPTHVNQRRNEAGCVTCCLGL